MYGSFYWTHPRFSDERFRAACEALDVDGAAGWREPVSPFLTLLRSGDQAAVGIALDTFQKGDAMSRFGGEPLYGDHEDEVLEAARELLRQPPSPADMSPHSGAGANHASALNAMMNLAEAQDGDLIADVLEGTANGEVVMAAAGAAGQALNDEAPHPRLLRLVASFVDDEGRPLDQRIRMLSVLDAAGAAPEAVDHLLRVLGHPEPRMQIHGAFYLACDEDRLEVHREVLERVVASWPGDAPYPADEVRMMLRGEY